MRSQLGFAGSIAFLAALPVAALCEAAIAGAGETAIHLVLALGAALMARAVFDFQTSRWVNWAASGSVTFLAVTFLLQGVGKWAANDALIHFAYRVLGQRLEAWAGYLFLGWCLTLLVADSRGWTRVVGVAAMALAVGERVYAYYLAAHAPTLGAEPPAMQVLALLPFAWLLLEARKAGSLNGLLTS